MKQANGYVSGNSAPGIRVLTNAAPLKLFGYCLSPRIGIGIRVLTNAAPLKRETAATTAIASLYPRSHERGPIEAASTETSAPPRERRIRVLTNAAPLKHRAWHILRIELPRRIRVLTNAAPLKLLTAMKSKTHSKACIRVLTNAAPLKHLLMDNTIKHGKSIRVLTNAAPLKPSWQDTARQFEFVSAFSRTRPH